MALMHSSA